MTDTNVSTVYRALRQFLPGRYIQKINVVRHIQLEEGLTAFQCYYKLQNRKNSGDTSKARRLYHFLSGNVADNRDDRQMFDVVVSDSIS